MRCAMYAGWGRIFFVVNGVLVGVDRYSVGGLFFVVISADYVS